MMQLAHLRQQFTHVARTAAGSGLIRCNGNPINQILREQATQRHQHQADGTVAAHKGFHAVVQAVGDHALVNRVENNDGIVFHAQRRRRVNPVALPAAFTQLWINFVGIIAALARHDNVERLQRFQIKGVLKRARRRAAERGRSLPELGSGEEDRADGVKIALFNHALHENRADHTAPADKTNVFHIYYFLQRCVLFVQTSIQLGYASHYKMLPKSQAKLIDDGAAISNTTNYNRNHRLYQG
ncbi:hypothetical protein D3C80_962550 [compost metagenome]